MLNESTLLIFCGLGSNRLALLSLTTHCNTTQSSSKDYLTNENLPKNQPVYVKYFKLDGKNEIPSFTWMPSNGLNSSHPLNGYLCESNSSDEFCVIYKIDFEKELSKIANGTETILHRIENIEPITNIGKVHCTVDDCTIFASSLMKSPVPVLLNRRVPVLLNLQFKQEN